MSLHILLLRVALTLLVYIGVSVTLLNDRKTWVQVSGGCAIIVFALDVLTLIWVWP